MASDRYFEIRMHVVCAIQRVRACVPWIYGSVVVVIQRDDDALGVCVCLALVEHDNYLIATSATRIVATL